MALRCAECGTRISSKAALPGHYRRAHGAARKAASAAGVESAREKLNRKPVERFSESGLGSALTSPAAIVCAPAVSPVGETSALPDRDSDVALYPGDRLQEPSFPLPDAVRLRAQYHALRVMAEKLDAGYGTDSEVSIFEQRLAEYNELFDRVSETGKGLPTQGESMHPLPHLGDESPAWWSLV